MNLQLRGVVSKIESVDPKNTDSAGIAAQFWTMASTTTFRSGHKGQTLEQMHVLLVL